MFRNTCRFKHHEVRNALNSIPHFSSSHSKTKQFFLTLHYNHPKHSGSPGNASIARSPSPPLFYVAKNRLWHFHNESTVLPIQLHNSTQSAKLPLQVIVGEDGSLSRRTAVKGGNWRWQGTMLRYEQGSHSTPLFYSCQDTNGLMGLYLHPEP